MRKYQFKTIDYVSFYLENHIVLKEAVSNEWERQRKQKGAKLNVRQGPFQQNKNPKAGRLQLEAAKSEIEEFFRNRDLSVEVKKDKKSCGIILVSEKNFHVNFSFYQKSYFSH